MHATAHARSPCSPTIPDGRLTSRLLAVCALGSELSRSTGVVLHLGSTRRAPRGCPRGIRQRRFQPHDHIKTNSMGSREPKGLCLRHPDRTHTVLATPTVYRQPRSTPIRLSAGRKANEKENSIGETSCVSVVRHSNLSGTYLDLISPNLIISSPYHHHGEGRPRVAGTTGGRTDPMADINRTMSNYPAFCADASTNTAITGTFISH